MSIDPATRGEPLLRGGRAPTVGEMVGSADGAGPPPRQQRADACRNRARLLESAAAAFADRGAEIPLEDVARAAGVGIGTLYRHFPTRDSLIEAVYRHEVDVLCEEADQLLATRPPDEALARWMQLFVRHVARKRGMASALRSMMGSGAKTFFDQSRARAVAAATTLLEAGVADGSVRNDIDGSDLLRAVGGICMSTEEEAEVSERLVALLFDGLRNRVPTAHPTPLA